jgi:flavin-dependent dehydrogenase
MKSEFDVVVVGGGPAGAAVATWLARAGHGVALLDRARFPRDKACGEFLTPKARTILEDLGVWSALRVAGARTLKATLLCAPDGSRARHAPAHGPAGYALRRVCLDAALLENARRAGVEGCAVRELLRADSGRVCGVQIIDAEGVPQSLCARLVIGADGAHSLVARRLGLVRALPRLQRIALVSHWSGVAGPVDAIEMRTSGSVVCGTLSPEHRPDAPNTANLTLVVPTAWASEIAGRAGDWVERTLQARFPDLAPRFAGAAREPAVRTVGCFGHVCRPAIADGALLVGDAATFIDPFTGEGVYFGLRGAQMAAEAADHSLRAGDTSRRSLWAYQRARRELAQRYLLCDMVQTVVRRPSLLNRVVRRLDRFPDAADRLLAVLGDLKPAGEVLHPALLWRLLAPEI